MARRLSKYHVPVSVSASTTRQFHYERYLDFQIKGMF